MYYKNEHIEVRMDIEDLRHFKIENSTALRDFIETMVVEEKHGIGYHGVKSPDQS